jgi:hypothetical protein
MTLSSLLQFVIEPGGKHYRGAQDPECLTATFRPWIKPNRPPALVASTPNRAIGEKP